MAPVRHYTHAATSMIVCALSTNLSSECLTSPCIAIDDQSIVLNATSLISHLCAGPQGWSYLHGGPDIRSLLFVSMVQSDSMQIRQTVLAMGTKFCLQK